MESVLIKSEKLRAAFTTIIDEDTAAFNRVMTAMNLSQETDGYKVHRIGGNTGGNKRCDTRTIEADGALR